MKSIRLLFVKLFKRKSKPKSKTLSARLERLEAHIRGDSDEMATNRMVSGK